MTRIPAPIATLKTRIRCLLMLASAFSAVLPLAAQEPSAATVSLPGQVLDILPKATHLARDPQRENDIVTIEVVLKPADEEGLRAFLKELEDPDSPNYHQPLEPSEVTARFGPTQEAYDKVLDYFTQNGFKLVIGSNNRRTITVRGTRAQAERAFHVPIDDYQLGDSKFHANASDPSLPAEIASLVMGVAGLSNPGEWQVGVAPGAKAQNTALAYVGNYTPAGLFTEGEFLPPGIDGSGQTVGIISFADYDDTDVSSFLSFNGLAGDLINSVQRFPVDGGGNQTGPDALKEAVLDVDTVLGIAPGAHVVVFEGPFNGNTSDVFTLINTAIDNVGAGGTLTTSAGRCEDLIEQSDAQSMDSLLEGAAASGITLFAFSGDFGANCPDGSVGVMYPGDAPHAVSVGGTKLHVNADGTYNHENWWNDSSGSGGFGTSRFQYPSKPGLIRAEPDAALDAAPLTSMFICLATMGNSFDPGGCGPWGGGTSMATPMFAAFWSMVNQARADGGLSPLSAGNGYLATVPHIFHNPSTMTGAGNDSTHVGLGSPKVVDLVSLAGPPVEVSNVSPNFGTADGSTPVTITGHGFIGVKKVTFEGVKATNVQVFSDSKMVVQAPAAPEAEVNIHIETPAGTSAEVSADKFHYIPVLATISDSHGPLAGGDYVTVTGIGLSAYHGFQYLFGGTPATGVHCASEKSCTMYTPEHALGPVSLVISTPFGNSPNSLPYNYAAPQITSFNPPVGPTTGGLKINIQGQNLATGMTVFFGSTAVTKGVSCVDQTFCWVTNPAVSGPESVSLSVTEDDVTSAPTSAQFSFQVFPTITGISQGSAPAGTTVTLTGTGFNITAPPSGAVPALKGLINPTVFTFFGINVNGSCSNTTQCTAVIPFNQDGPGVATAVTVTVDGNTSLDYVVFRNPGKPLPCKGITCN